tara:strand:- start:99 stop:284 length:186 start_codon:yes stop_codon:yes gene_type:complete
MVKKNKYKVIDRIFGTRDTYHKTEAQAVKNARFKNKRQAEKTGSNISFRFTAHKITKKRRK